MSCCSFPTNLNGLNPAQSQTAVQTGQGMFIGTYLPGTNTQINSITGNAQQGIPASANALTIQADTGFISSLTTQPQNVLRLTGAFGTSYIQGSNIAFAMPYSGNAGVRILPSTNQINVNNLVYVSTIAPIGNGGVGTAGQINMTQLASTIKGYGWAQVL